MTAVRMTGPGGIEPMPDYAEIGITTNFSFLRGRLGSAHLCA